MYRFTKLVILRQWANTYAKSMIRVDIYIYVVKYVKGFKKMKDCERETENEKMKSTKGCVKMKISRKCG